MKLVMIAAVSSDGYIADDNGSVTNWTSSEDKAFFSSMKAQHTLYVMGSGTFDPSFVKPQKGILRIVLTRHPEKYASFAVDGRLEFHSLSPQEFVQKYSRYSSCLVLGGSHVYEAFLQHQLINEIFLTTEPVKLHAGTSILASSKILSLGAFKLVLSSRLNVQGTRLNHYVLKK